MTFAAAIAAALATAAPAVASTPQAAPPSLQDIAQAIEAGRLEQARLMLSRAMTMGQGGPPVDRLLADLAFEAGNNAEALARYQKLIPLAGYKADITERAGIAAMKLGEFDRALPLIEMAISRPEASWRAWNAKGALADMRSDWPAADAAYDKAAALAPDRAEVLNNRGWSLLLRGRWEGASSDLERAAAIAPSSERIANNLELARAGLANDLPPRRAGESAQSWAQRLNDAGMAARARGNQMKAIAAFTQAIDVSGPWYARAANNLEATTASR